MKWALTDDNGNIKNILIYDGKAEYEPEEGLALQQVNDWLEIGDNIKLADPSK